MKVTATHLKGFGMYNINFLPGALINDSLKHASAVSLF